MDNQRSLDVDTKSNLRKSQDSSIICQNKSEAIEKCEEHIKQNQSIALKRLRQMNSRIKTLGKEMESLRKENNQLLKKERYLLVQRRIIEHMWTKIQKYSEVTESMQETLIESQLDKAESNAKLYHSIAKMRDLEAENSNLGLQQNQALCQISIVEKEKKKIETTHSNLFDSNIKSNISENEGGRDLAFLHQALNAYTFEDIPTFHQAQIKNENINSHHPNDKENSKQISEKEKINHKIHQTIQNTFRLKHKLEN